jgi:hypothetical protein
VHGHWPFVVILSAGLALRVLTEAAYHPALLYIDSAKYLVSSGGTAPEGYQVLLRLLDPIGGLALVAAVQHAFGLAMAIALYALPLRRGVPRWAATLAAAPVLLDAYRPTRTGTRWPSSPDWPASTAATGTWWRSSRPPPCCATTSSAAATRPARCTRPAWPPGCSDRSPA